MTATEELRRMLDERGVEWWCGEDERKTYWRSNDLTWEYFNDENGDAWLGFLGACESDVTPAQAIAATLGDADATPTRQGVGPMTLAEAIAHEDWAATTAHGELADEHAQMRDWLRELERLRSARDVWQENDAKLRELVRDMMWTIRHAHGYFKNDTHEMLMTHVRGRDGKPTYVAYSLTCDEEMYEKRMKALGIEVES